MNKLIQSTIIILGLLTAAVTFVQANNELDTVEKTETITLGAVVSKYPDAIVSEVARGHVTSYHEVGRLQFDYGTVIRFKPLNAEESIILDIELLSKKQKKRLQKAYHNNAEIVLRFMEVSFQLNPLDRDFKGYELPEYPRDTMMTVRTTYAAIDVLKRSSLITATMEQKMEEDNSAFSTTSMQGRILQVRRSKNSIPFGPAVACHLTVYSAETQEQKNINIVSESMCSYAEQAILANKGFADVEYTHIASWLTISMLDEMYYNWYGFENYLLSISSRDATSIAPSHH